MNVHLNATKDTRKAPPIGRPKGVAAPPPHAAHLAARPSQLLQRDGLEVAVPPSPMIQFAAQAASRGEPVPRLTSAIAGHLSTAMSPSGPVDAEPETYQS